MSASPFGLNQDRRRRIPRRTHKVTNRAAYDASLRQRGSPAVWFSAEAVEAWTADTEPRTRGHSAGPGDEAFSRRVSAALDTGYELYGSPCVTFDGERVIVAQAVLRPGKASAAKVVPEATADSILVLQEQEIADDIGPPRPGV